MKLSGSGCDLWFPDRGYKCCSPDNQCDEGEGECDSNADCIGTLRCGFNNCDQTAEPNPFPENARCCTADTGNSSLVWFRLNRGHYEVSTSSSVEAMLIPYR